jgi:serine/threonine-protein kinase
VRADGSSQPELLVETKGISIAGSFTKDGKRFAFADLQGLPQIFTVSIEEKDGRLTAGKPEQFLKSNSGDVQPAFSPDGRWLAYQSTELGTPEIYVRPFPPPASGKGGKWPISNGGGTNPVWSSNGRELLYQFQDKIMAVSYTVKGDAFVPDRPRVWIPNLGGTGWDLHPDGKRIAVTTPMQIGEAPQQDHEVVFLFNFFDELRRRVPVGK